jgi:MoaA/NifB/PqqE/SkfB family radical SAM enzyme
MKLSGLHILLTYQCTFECSHCFVWGSPRQSGTFSIEQIEDVLHQAKEAGVEWIYFEGGEPFLYYMVMLKGVELATEMGFHVGVVTNGYWAHTPEDTLEWLLPLKKLEDLSISSDLYHYTKMMSQHARNIIDAASQLHIPIGVISVALPGQMDSVPSHGQIPENAPAQVMYRGRAASRLLSRAKRVDYHQFTSCLHEDMQEPGRVHLDPFGNLHICQGIVIGNLFEKPLKQICEEYDASVHPICKPLMDGGPVALVEQYDLEHDAEYADGCHLCYSMRLKLRDEFPNQLGPDQMYGVKDERK